MESDLMDLLILLNSDNENDINLGIGIFNAQYFNKGINFPLEFKKGLKPKWSNFSLEYKRRRIVNDSFKKDYYIYLI